MRFYNGILLMRFLLIFALGSQNGVTATLALNTGADLIYVSSGRASLVGYIAGSGANGMPGAVLWEVY